MININFETNVINRNFYLKAINEIFLYWHIRQKDIDKWNVNLYPISHEKNNADFFKDLVDVPTSDKMAWGNTGKQVINCFLHDTNDYRKMLENFVVISHEIGHAIGMILFNGKPKIYVNEIHDIYYLYPKYKSLEVFDKTIRILNLGEMMEKLRVCSIRWIFEERIKLNAYAINYYRSKLFVRIVVI